jgi:hypothetical protein
MQAKDNFHFIKNKTESLHTKHGKVELIVHKLTYIRRLNIRFSS